MPRVADRHAVPYVDRAADPLDTPALDQSSRQRGLLQRSRSNDDACRSRLQGGLDGGLSSKPTGDLAPCLATERGDDVPKQPSLPGSAGASSVEVDDVQPRYARFEELRGGGDGVVSVDRLASEFALHQADDLAVTQVDRGKELEG